MPALRGARRRCRAPAGVACVVAGLAVGARRTRPRAPAVVGPVPHCQPACAHVFTAHPHSFLIPPPPHTSGNGHPPQSRTFPQPSLMLPHAPRTSRGHRAPFRTCSARCLLRSWGSGWALGTNEGLTASRRTSPHSAPASRSSGADRCTCGCLRCRTCWKRAFPAVEEPVATVVGGAALHAEVVARLRRADRSHRHRLMLPGGTHRLATVSQISSTGTDRSCLRDRWRRRRTRRTRRAPRAPPRSRCSSACCTLALTASLRPQHLEVALSYPGGRCALAGSPPWTCMTRST